MASSNCLSAARRHKLIFSSGDERILGKKKKLAFWGWTGFVAWKLTANSDQQLPFSIMYWSILSITITETQSGFPFHFAYLKMTLTSKK